MAFVVPRYTRGEVNRAGVILKNEEAIFAGAGTDDLRPAVEQIMWAYDVLANWRGAHTYPINTFQALLRSKLKSIDPGAIVAQRLKRAPSIVFKLKRFDKMQLARMQDIGGLRAVLKSMPKVRRLEAAYRKTRFSHKLVSSKNYIDEPKTDGYRGIHLIYRYVNQVTPDYNDLQLELQFRTRLQHAWATAVETMGTFLGQALKSGQGEQDWRRFFAVCGAALASVEKTAQVPGFEGRSNESICQELANLEAKLRVLEKLRGFAIAGEQITRGAGQGAYHLIVLDSGSKSVYIEPFPVARLEDATSRYTFYEKKTKAGEPIEAVLVSAGPISALRKAYPNYFLDTSAFIRQIEQLIEPHSVGPKQNRIRFRKATRRRR